MGCWKSSSADLKVAASVRSSQGRLTVPFIFGVFLLVQGIRLIIWAFAFEDKVRNCLGFKVVASSTIVTVPRATSASLALSSANGF
jgi:hypothetical protein